MKTPEQSVISLIKELRAKGVKYNQLMAERDRAENGDDDEDEDDDSVYRSTESIDREIYELLGDTMDTARQLICDKDTDGDGDCHECHRTGGCPNLQPPPPAVEKPHTGMFTVCGYYDDTGHRYVGHHAAETVAAAIEQCASVHSEENICVVAVIAGEHKDLMEGDYVEDTEDIQQEPKRDSKT